MMRESKDGNKKNKWKSYLKKKLKMLLSFTISLPSPFIPLSWQVERTLFIICFFLLFSPFFLEGGGFILSFFLCSQQLLILEGNSWSKYEANERELPTRAHAPVKSTAFSFSFFFFAIFSWLLLLLLLLFFPFSFFFSSWFVGNSPFHCLPLTFTSSIPFFFPPQLFSFLYFPSSSSFPFPFSFCSA